jgi:mevalonate kinase
MTTASAPGKVILFGEHAVVYGQPAIAAPVTQVRAYAVVQNAQPDAPSGVYLRAPDLNFSAWLADTEPDNPLTATIHQFQKAAGWTSLPNLVLTVTSTIPIAGGLGSGAAISAAVLRALARHLHRPDLATNEQVSALAYEVEKIHHGTPSGIDNTVVTYEQPVYFLRREPHNLIETFVPARPVRLLVADTGVRSITRRVVKYVREQWLANQDQYEELFAACGQITGRAREAISGGDLPELGRLMIENQQILREMGVSSPELEKMVAAAGEGGAIGAKLSGAGWGGNMIALVDEQHEEDVRQALFAAGAATLLLTVLE